MNDKQASRGQGKPQKPRPFCYWTDEAKGHKGYTCIEDAWRTDCDNLFQFNDAGPRENGFTFCPYCGSPLKVKS